MNPLYEKLIADFLAEANIERDATLIAETLKKAYPVHNLPSPKTIKRFIKGETANPQAAITGFMAAYVLNISQKEVEKAANYIEQVGAFFQTYREGYEKELADKAKEESTSIDETDLLLEQSHEEINKLKMRVGLYKTLLSIILIISAFILIRYWHMNYQPRLVGLHPLHMIPVKGGKFSMGDTNSEDLSMYNDSKPAHSVTVDSFEMSDTEITFELFDLYCNYRNIPLKEDLGWGRKDHPAIMLDWYEAVDFCNWLSEISINKMTSVYTIERGKNGIVNRVLCDFKANGYRLPTEAEWEYAAAIEVKTGKKYRFGHHSPTLHPDTVNFDCGKDGQNEFSTACNTKVMGTRPVKHSGKNNNELYDMCGNVDEWCQDYYDAYFYDKSINAVNPAQIDSGTYRVIRGGAWNTAPSDIRTSFRDRSPPMCRDEATGFRVVRRVQKQK